MPVNRVFAGLLVIVALLIVSAAVACGDSAPAPDVDATIAAGVQATVDANALAKAASTSTPVPIPPTPTPADTPTPAPTQMSVPINTPVPSATPVPTPTPEPTAPPQPTNTPLPTHTPLPTATPTLAQMIEDIERSLVYIETDTGNGTGFVVEEDGLVVTNEHVIEGFNTVTIVMSDGRAYEGDVLGTDEIADLAIVKLNTTEKFEAIQLGNSDDVRVGDDVIALGFPLSYELGNSLTVTKGIISSKRVYGGIEELQTDAAINPGNSGGPLMSRAGKVVGINYAKLALSDGSPVDNIGFSIAINELKDRMDSLKRGEQVLLPMPTPGTWATYRNDDYGYSLEIAPGWYLDEESDEIDRAFWHEDGTSLV